MIFFNYVFKRFIKNIFNICVVCLFIHILFDFIQRNPRYFSKFNTPASLIVEYYAYQTPSIFIEVMPIAVLLGSVITVIMLARTNEITAVRAAGGGLRSLAGPLFVGGFAVSAVLLATMEGVLPVSTQHFFEVKKVEIEDRGDKKINFTKTWLRLDDKVYNYSRYDPVKKVIHDLRVDILSERFTPKKTIRASLAIAKDDSNETSIWGLEDAQIFFFDEENQLIAKNYRKTLDLELPIQPKSMQNTREDIADYSISELYNLILQGRSKGVSVKDYEMEMHQKTSLLVLVLIVSLIGLRFSFFFERNTEVVFGILTAVFIGMSYWLILGTTKALSSNGILQPFWACWLPNIIMIFIVAIDLRVAKKDI